VTENDLLKSAQASGGLTLSVQASGGLVLSVASEVMSNPGGSGSEAVPPAPASNSNGGSGGNRRGDRGGSRSGTNNSNRGGRCHRQSAPRFQGREPALQPTMIIPSSKHDSNHCGLHFVLPNQLRHKIHFWHLRLLCVMCWNQSHSAVGLALRVLNLWREHPVLLLGQDAEDFLPACHSDEINLLDGDTEHLQDMMDDPQTHF